MVEINEAEGKKKKRIKRNEDNRRDLWNNVKCPNIWIIGVPEEETKRKAMRKYWGILIGWKERGCISSSVSQESLPFNEGSGVDHTSGSNGPGRTTVSLPLKREHPTVTSSLNLILFTYFYFLIESFWRTSAKTSWVGGCVFGNLIAILPSTEPTFKMSMMN